MARRVGVDLEPFDRVEVVGRLEQPGAEGHGFVMGGPDVVDVQIEVDLLRRAVRPVGLDVVRRELDTEPPLAVDQDAVPVVVGDDPAPQQSGPEGALGSEVRRVEHDDLSLDPHAAMMPSPAGRVLSPSPYTPAAWVSWSRRWSGPSSWRGSRSGPGAWPWAPSSPGTATPWPRGGTASPSRTRATTSWRARRWPTPR